MTGRPSRQPQQGICVRRGTAAQGAQIRLDKNLNPDNFMADLAWQFSSIVNP